MARTHYFAKFVDTLYTHALATDIVGGEEDVIVSVLDFL